MNVRTLPATVIVCTHNPRPEYLRRTLQALADQTFPRERWELLVIDNASAGPVAGRFDLAWHPGGRHVREEALGLTAARLRGIAESVGALLVFVDDDNVLDPDYLQQAQALADAFPALGAFGGQTLPEFEVPAPDWTRPYWGHLALRETPRDVWSNLYSYETAPCGAGMCIRRAVALRYAETVAADPWRRQLDRRGSLLSSCGDSDLAFTACDLGLGTARFTRLRLRHLIPAERLTRRYLLDLCESLACSERLLFRLRGLGGAESGREARKNRLAAWLGPFLRNSFSAAVRRGRHRAGQMLRSLPSP